MTGGIMRLPNLSTENADWQKIYEVASVCGSAHNPRSFAIDMVASLKGIIDFNQAIAYFFDASGVAVGQYQKNVSSDYSELYLKYQEMIKGKQNPFGDDRELFNNPSIFLFDWSRPEYYEADFIKKNIAPRRLTYSCDFALHDLNGAYRLVVALDRTTSRPFSEQELVNVQLAVRLLNSMYRNFFYRDEPLGNVTQAEWVAWHLTAREIEVVDLMAQGVKPRGIADKLSISPATCNKHIQHIYQKMGISSRQELLVKVLGNARE